MLTVFFSIYNPPFSALRARNESPSRGTKSPNLVLRGFRNLRLISFATFSLSAISALDRSREFTAAAAEAVTKKPFTDLHHLFLDSIDILAPELEIPSTSKENFSVILLGWSVPRICCQEVVIWRLRPKAHCRGVFRLIRVTCTAWRILGWPRAFHTSHRGGVTIL